MPEPLPRSLPAADIERLLAGARGLSALPARLDRLSAALLGAPYAVAPLIGSATASEELVVRLDAFDCVTYVETVLALGWGETVEAVVAHLVALRYRDGHVGWLERNHYMTTWLDRNTAEGRFVPVLQRAWIGADEVRHLSVLPGYPDRTWHPRYLPRSAVDGLAAEVQAGDLACFVAPRDDLDVYHVGLLIPADGAVRLRHAGRARGEVVDQPLTEYLSDHPDCPGLLVARPIPRS